MSGELSSLLHSADKSYCERSFSAPCGAVLGFFCHFLQGTTLKGAAHQPDLTLGLASGLGLGRTSVQFVGADRRSDQLNHWKPFKRNAESFAVGAVIVATPVEACESLTGVASGAKRGAGLGEGGLRPTLC